MKFILWYEILIIRIYFLSILFIIFFLKSYENFVLKRNNGILKWYKKNYLDIYFLEICKLKGW